VDDIAGAEVDSHGETEAAPGDLATTLAQALAAELGTRLVGVIAHGSWVHGDFSPGRSDLDLLVILRDEPSPDLLTRVEPVLAKAVEARPQWSDRIELGFVTREAVEDVLANAGMPHRAARVSPGEPLHLVDAERHQILDWEAASRGVTVYGAEPSELLPTIPADTLRAVVREHLGWWRSQGAGVTKAARPGHQSYVVLTVCRAAAFLSTGERRSKRQAARWATAAYPRWSSLIDWAERWWYEGGSEDESARPAAGGLERFVEEVSAGWDDDAAPGSSTSPS
jgi:aminoglycoside adenylyltransferase-like protein/nucleotidyltransferase-like protein